MTNLKSLYFWAFTITLFVSFAVFSACQSTTEPEPPIEPEPIERVGERTFTFTVIDRKSEEELTGYNIDIAGPVTASETNVSTAQFILADVESGEYTITVSLNGYVNSEITEVLEVPEETSADYAGQTTISLRETTPPVTVDNTVATTVQTGEPDEEDATEEEAVTLEIPANTFPADVVNEDGTVDISVTRAKPADTDQTDDGLSSESIILTPAATLNNPVTITIPIRDIEGLENLTYALQPGNIPLVPDGSGNLVATITPDHSSNGFSPANINTNATLTNFQEYKVISPNTTLTSTDGIAGTTTFVSGCGEALNEILPVPLIFLPPSIAKFRLPIIPPPGLIVTVPAQQDRQITIDASYVTRTFRLEQDGSLIAEATINLGILKTSVPIRSACHGGSN